MESIQEQVQAEIPNGFSGLCHLFCTHTTAGLTVNENADPDVRHDLLLALDRTVPEDNPGYRHFEGNSAAHLKAALMGFDVTLPVENGKLALGRWQTIYFCEFDGPRERQGFMTLIPSDTENSGN